MFGFGDLFAKAFQEAVDECHAEGAFEPTALNVRPRAVYDDSILEEIVEDFCQKFAIWSDFSEV